MGAESSNGGPGDIRTLPPMKPIDTLGVDGRVQIAAETLNTIQAEAYRLTVLRGTNGHEPADVVPGETFTYEEQTAKLARMESNLYDTLDPRVHDALRERLKGV